MKTKVDRNIAVLLLVGFTAAFITTAAVHGPVRSDALVMMRVSQRIWNHGFKPTAGVPNTKSFSKYGLGQSLVNLLVTPAYTAARKPTSVNVRIHCFLAVAALPAVLGALGAMCFYLCLRELKYRRRLAVISTVVFSFGSFAWVYTQMLFSDPTVGLCLLLAFLALLKHKNGSGLGVVVLAGAAAGFALLTKIFAAFALPVFFCYLLHTSSRGEANQTAEAARRAQSHVAVLGAFMVPIAVCCAVLLWYNDIRSGNMMNFSYSTGRDLALGFNTPFLTGIYGYLFSSGKGFFFYAPVCLLAFWGIRGFWNNHRPELLVLTALVAGTVLIHAGWWAWHGDWSWGPRFLVGLPPFFGIVGTEALARLSSHLRSTAALWHRRMVLFGTVCCVVVSALIQIPGLCIDVDGYIGLASVEAKVFRYPFYRKNDWPLRDDGVHVRFIPEFSPLAAHTWLFRILLTPSGEGRNQLMEKPPWASLNPKWIPSRAWVDQLARWNIWWIHATVTRAPGWKTMLLEGIVLLVISATALSLAFIFSVTTRADDEAAPGRIAEEDKCSDEANVLEA